MTEPTKTIMAERISRAKATVKALLAADCLTFLGLENALAGLSLEQRLSIKRELRTAGQLP